MLLERIDYERRQGDDLVARILARAHYETWVTAEYLLLDGTDAYERLIGAQKHHYETQKRRLDEHNARLRLARKAVLKKNAKIRKNERIADKGVARG